MAPPTWATPEQTAFFNESLTRFFNSQKNGRLDKFWPEFEASWFEKWPIDPATDTAGLEVKAKKGVRVHAFGKLAILTIYSDSYALHLYCLSTSKSRIGSITEPRKDALETAYPRLCHSRYNSSVSGVCSTSRSTPANTTTRA